MSLITKSFTATGVSASINVRPKETATYSVSGTFSGTVVLERGIGTSAWEPVGTFTVSASGIVTAGVYRFRCSAYTSGTIVTALSDASDTFETWMNLDGGIPFQITETGAKVDLISEVTADAGVTIDGLLAKDGTLSFASLATGVGKLVLGDNLASALDVTEGANSYLKFVTTNSAEKVVAGKAVEAAAGLDISGGSLTMDGGTGTAVSDAVTISKPVGVITTESKTTAAAGTYTITLTNTLIAATSIVLASINVNSGAGTPVITSIVPGAGSCTITVRNAHASAAFDSAHKISFLVVQP
jgi:hypothetical protein